MAGARSLDTIPPQGTTNTTTQEANKTQGSDTATSTDANAGASASTAYDPKLAQQYRTIEDVKWEDKNAATAGGISGQNVVTLSNTDKWGNTLPEYSVWDNKLSRDIYDWRNAKVSEQEIQKRVMNRIDEQNRINENAGISTRRSYDMFLPPQNQQGATLIASNTKQVPQNANQNANQILVNQQGASKALPLGTAIHKAVDVPVTKKT